LPHSGIWPQVVLTWDAIREKYVVVNGHSLKSKRKIGSEEPAAWSREEWRAKHVESVRAAVLTIKAVRTDEGEAEDARQVALLRLASSLTSLLWAGDVEAARALNAETNLSSYATMKRDEPVTREQWWTIFVAACKTSRYWPALCDAYPALLDL